MARSLSQRHPAGTARSQLKLFLGAYLLYTIGRWVTVADIDPATEHAEWIMDAEQQFGVRVESSVQQALDGGAVMWLLSNLYMCAQFVVVPGALVYLYRRAPEIYRRLRDTVLATWMLAVPIYALFPVAPPRLADASMIDTVSAQAPVQLSGRSTMFYNELAAVPSLHCGFAVAVGIALAFAARRPLTKALALLWGPTVCLTVVATGNHYLFDIAAGLAVSVVGFGVGTWLSSRSVKRPRIARPVTLEPQPA